MDKFRILYIDEEESWRSEVYNYLNEYFDILILEELPQNVSDIWELIINFNPDGVLLDYKLNLSGTVSYSGDDVANEIKNHNKHLPIFMITSFEDGALAECKEIQVIRGKEILTKQTSKLKSIIESGVNIYKDKIDKYQSKLIEIQNKIKNGETLSENDKADKFDAELYLNELDLDSGARNYLVTETSSETLVEMLQTAQELLRLMKN